MVFLLIMNQMEFNLVHNQKENCFSENILLDLYGIFNRFLTVHIQAPGNLMRLAFKTL